MDDKYTIKYELSGCAVHFKVYQIICTKEDGTEPEYEIKNAESGWQLTKNLEDAQTILSGMVKWDGCSHYYFGEEDGYIHLCGERSITSLSKLITEIYKKCGDIMQENNVTLIENYYIDL